MTTSCLTLIKDLGKSIDEINNKLVDHMTNFDVEYDSVCVQPRITYDYFFNTMKEQWEEKINNFIQNPDKCGTSTIANLIPYYDIIRSQSGKEFDPKEMMIQVLQKVLLAPSAGKFELDQNANKSLTDFVQVLATHCQCQVADIFKVIIEEYKPKYQKKLEGKSQEEIISIIKNDYDKFMEFVNNISNKDSQFYQKQITDNIATELAQIHQFSVGNELDRLIPNELGTLKQFFITVITKYFNDLHPIVWAQMYKQMVKNIFIELPDTSDEFFRFFSKHVLLNSGPFILKTLQMIRPILTPELATKYNLTKLTYPLLTKEQVNTVLRKIIPKFEDTYVIDRHVSASVGHVCIIHNVKKPRDVFVIKIIKPLAIAQSCWEYKTLYDLFDKGTCEQAFVRRILESNGREMNLKHEEKNLRDGNKYYSATYADTFKTPIPIDAKLSTINVKDGIIDEKCWFALAMTLAPGIPLAKLIENNLLNEDTRYRAKLHRCLDLLVYKFFHNIINNKFYHGDLHSGNIFFSYEHSQITLIDFGATGELDLLDKSGDIVVLTEIIIMSTFHNFDEILDKMTILLNSKCPESKIDMNTSEYAEFKRQLFDHKLNNIVNSKIDRIKQGKYKDFIFGEERIKAEESLVEIPKEKLIPIESIYSYLEYKGKEEEPIIENKDTLLIKPTIEESDSISFPEVLEQIIKFYATSGVNIAIKFNELYEFQKAYALLLGVLKRVNYNPYRIGIAIKEAVVNLGNITNVLSNPGRFSNLYNLYRNEQQKFNSNFESIQSNKYPEQQKIDSNIEVELDKSKQLSKYQQLRQKLISNLKQTVTTKPQSGGVFLSDDDARYRYKYLKYKSKYIQLKQSRQYN